MKKALFLLLTGLCLIVALSTPAAAQWFHRLGHVGKSKTKKAEHSTKHVKRRDKQKSKKRNPNHDERRRRQEAQRQEKRRAEGPRTQPAAIESETTPEPRKSNS